MRRLAAVVAGAAAGAASLAPLWAHLHVALAGGGLSPAQQRAFFLPWQLADNVVSGRGPWDASVFAWGGEAGLLAIYGNPGVAALLAPLHVLLAPIPAHAVGLAALVASNAIALAWAGANARTIVLGAAIGAGAGWWGGQLGAGALAAGWAAPGLALWATGGRGAGAIALGVVGALVAPVPTAAGVVAALLDPPDRARGAWGPPLLGVAALAVVIRALAPPLGAGAGIVSIQAVVWPAGGVAIGAPIAASIGIAAALADRGGRRLLAAVAVVAALAATGPWAVDAGGEALTVGAFKVPLFPWSLGGLRTELMAAAILLGQIAAFQLLSAWAPGVWAAAALCLAEAPAQAMAGQPVGIWTGARWVIPPAIADARRAPRVRVFLQLPAAALQELAVAYVPFHQQRVVGGTDGGVLAAALAAKAAADPTVGALVNVGNIGLGAEPHPITPRLMELGFTDVVVFGPDPGTLAAVQLIFGRADAEHGVATVWRLRSGRRGGWDGPPPSDAP